MECFFLDSSVCFSSFFLPGCCIPWRHHGERRHTDHLTTQTRRYPKTVSEYGRLGQVTTFLLLCLSPCGMLCVCLFTRKVGILQCVRRDSFVVEPPFFYFRPWHFETGSRVRNRFSALEEYAAAAYCHSRKNSPCCYTHSSPKMSLFLIPVWEF